MTVPPICTWMPLVDPAACARNLAGGKAATLARLAQAGFCVPPGVVIPTGMVPDKTGAVEILRTCFRPDDILAVRSTAFVEDGAEQSHAGQFRTVLNVRGPAALCRAIAAVRASYASASADPQSSISDPQSCGVGPVLVQRQVDARMAGVCFTADPGSGIESLLIVEAVRGLGEGLVSGHVDPLYVRIDRRTRDTVAVRGFRIGSPDGREFLHVARRIAELAERAERALDIGALDIEWAHDGERIWLLQARPVTAPIFPLPSRAPMTEPEVWLHGNFAETMPGAVSPLAWDVLRQTTLRQKLPLGAERVLRELRVDLIECIAGRVCWNVGFLACWGFLNDRTMKLMSLIDARMSAEVDRMHREGQISLRGEPTAIQRGWFLLAAALLGARVMWGMLGSWRKGRVAALNAMGKASHELIRRSSDGNPADLTPEEAWRRARSMIRGTWPCLEPHIGTFLLLGIPLAFGSLAARWSGRSLAEVSSAMLDQEPSWARLMDDALRRLGQSLRDAGAHGATRPEALPAQARETFNAFMAEFGHRAPGEQDLLQLRFRERPEVVIRLALRATDGHRQSSCTLNEEQLLVDVRVRGCFGSLRAAILKWLAPKARHWAPVREDAKHVFWMPLWDRLRILILRTGEGLRDRGILEQAEDVFLFSCDELDRICADRVEPGRVRKLAAQRRRQQNRLGRFDFPPVIRSDGVPVVLSADERNGVLHGVPVSGGVFEGPVRVARSFEDAMGLQSGEVLVATHLDPGWTALFSRAGALVMEVGGVVSHAAVIAREMGIPAVFGVTGATRTLRNGQRVHIDGRTGSVRPSDQRTDNS